MATVFFLPLSKGCEMSVIEAIFLVTGWDVFDIGDVFIGCSSIEVYHRLNTGDLPDLVCSW